MRFGLLVIDSQQNLLQRMLTEIEDKEAVIGAIEGNAAELLLARGRRRGISCAAYHLADWGFAD